MNKLQLINKYILKPLRLAEVSSFATSLFEVFPYNLILPLFDEACTVFSNEFTWLWSLTTTELIYDANNNYVYDLRDYYIHRNKVKRVYFIENNQVYELGRLNYEDYKDVYMAWTTATGRPQFYTQKGYLMYFYPRHDKDYSIKIDHYKDVLVPMTETETIDIVPEKIQIPIPLYIKWLLAITMEKKNYKAIEIERLSELAKANEDNQKYYDVTDHMPSALSWDY